MKSPGFAAQPGQGEPIAGRDGRVSRAWANYFAQLALAQTGDDLRQLYEALAARVAELADGQTLRIIGRNSVYSAGTSVVEIQLVGDDLSPGNTEYYGTGPDGAKGFFPVADAIEVEDTEVEKVVGADGVVTLGLADVPDGGGGTLQKTAFDAKGRKSGTSVATTDDLDEGTGNLYYTDVRVDARIAAQKGVANGLATLDAGAKLPANQLPALAITDTFVVASQSAMLALAAERGDVAVRTDLQKSFILTAEPAGTLGNWQELLVPTGNPGTVTSVALSVPTGLAVAGSPITSSGTFTVSYAAGYQGYTSVEATKLSGIAAGATVGATWGANLASIPANITSWAGIAPATKADASALAGKYDKSGGPITGAVSLLGNSSRFVFYDDNLDVPVIDVGAGYGTATDRNGYIANRNATGFIEVSAFNFSRRFRLVSDGFLFNGPLYQSDDNLYSAGTASARFSVVYAGTGTINTSDAREKTPVRPLTAVELAAAIELGGEIGTYKWLAMVEAKGEAAREHIGLTVQRAIEVMRSHGLDPLARGFICYDAWDELPEVLGDEGEVVQEHRPAGDRYSFRMDELLAFIARGLAHRLDAVERRLAAAGL